MANNTPRKGGTNSGGRGKQLGNIRTIMGIIHRWKTRRSLIAPLTKDTPTVNIITQIKQVYAEIITESTVSYIASHTVFPNMPASAEC